MAEVTASETSRVEGPAGVQVPIRSFIAGIVALRVFIGCMWMSNALAKVFERSHLDFGHVFSLSLIDRAVARGIATDAASKSRFPALRGFYKHVVLPRWGFFQVLLTVSEVAIGIGLLAGIATRLAAVGGLALIAPIWVMLFDVRLYLWDYPADLFPLVLLALIPAGRVAGIDRMLAPRFGGRWPF